VRESIAKVTRERKSQSEEGKANKRQKDQSGIYVSPFLERERGVFTTFSFGCV
jgi:hypothetical protein